MFRYVASLVAAAALAVITVADTGQWRPQGIQYKFSVLPEEDVKVNVKRAPDVKPPPAYDFAVAHPECAGEPVKERGLCASGWALGVARLVTARRCLAGKGRDAISSGRLLACCKSCGGGCYGGNHVKALQWLVRGPGVPTEACHPYSTLALETSLRHWVPACPLIKRCTVAGPTFSEIRIGEVYSVADIEREVSARGPVLAYVKLYSDVVNYKPGNVYSRGSGASLLGREPLLITGWGPDPRSLPRPRPRPTTSLPPYWIVQTTLGNGLGVNGTIWLRRGDPALDIERYVVAITP